MNDVLLTSANYLLCGMVNIYATLLCLGEVFGRRRSLVPLLVFFFVRNAFDVVVFYLFPQSWPQLRVVEFAWYLILLCVAILLVAHTFETTLLQALLYLQGFGMVLSAMQNSTYALVNGLCDVESGGDYFVPISMRTLVSLTLFVLQYLALKRLIVLVVNACIDFARRHPAPVVGAFVAVAAFHMGTVFLSYSASQDLGILANVVNRPFYWFLLLVPLLLMSGFQVLAFFREARRQQMALARFDALVSGYERRVRVALATLERDRVVLEGLDTELMALRDEADSSILSARIERLEADLERLSHNSYCDNHVLDALLLSHAARLEELGVMPRFSVAGLTPDAVVHPEAVFVLLDAVSALAARSRGIEGTEVVLRLRPSVGGLFVHLELPRSWGRLRATRIMRGMGLEQEVLVRERIESGHTLVLMKTLESCDDDTDALHEEAHI